MRKEQERKVEDIARVQRDFSHAIMDGRVVRLSVDGGREEGYVWTAEEITGECRRWKREQTSPEKRTMAAFVGNDGGGKRRAVRSRNNSGFSSSHSCHVLPQRG